MVLMFLYTNNTSLLFTCAFVIRATSRRTRPFLTMSKTLGRASTDRAQSPNSTRAMASRKKKTKMTSWTMTIRSLTGTCVS